MRRSLLLTVVLTLALCATASAQAPPAELWDSGAAVGGAAGEDGRSVLLFALALVAFAGAGGVAVLAFRAPRRPHADAGGGVPRPRREQPRADRTRRLLPDRPREVRPEAPPPRPEWHPRVSGGPPPLPAFGPGSQAGPTAAPPPPD